MKLSKNIAALLTLCILSMAAMSFFSAQQEASAGRYYNPTLQGTLNGVDTVDLGVLLLSKWSGSYALRAKHTTGTANVTMYLEESDWPNGYDAPIYWRTIDSINIVTGDFDSDSLAVDRISATSVQGVRQRFRFGTVSDTVEYILRPVFKLE